MIDKIHYKFTFLITATLQVKLDRAAKERGGTGRGRGGKGYWERRESEQALVEMLAYVGNT